MQQRLDSMPPHIKNFSFERLSLRNYIITHKDLHTYLYDLFSAELSNFSELIKSSIYEFKLAIYLVDPVENLTKQQEKLYELQRKVFKYVNVDDLKMNYELRTDEDVLKAYSL